MAWFDSIQKLWLDYFVWVREYLYELILEEYLIHFLHHQEYAEYISQYDDMYASIQQIISYMTDGIAAQFNLSHPKLPSS